jgi:hypothetical protein
MGEEIQVNDDSNLVEIKGRVMGVFKGQFTRPISPALVYLKIVIGNFTFSPFDENSGNDSNLINFVRNLSDTHPKLFEEILKYINCFKPCLVNEQGIFIFKVPKIELGYTFAVIVKKDNNSKLTLISENNLSFNGINGNGPISGNDLNKIQKKEIIIAVEDKLWENSYSEPIRSDPTTDPHNVTPGVKEDDD